MTRFWERFRALPTKLQVLIWTGIAAMVVVGVAVPTSSSTSRGGPAAISSPGVVPATGTSTTVPPPTAASGTVSSSTSTSTSTSPSPSPTTTAAAPKTTTTTATPSKPSAESELAQLRIAAEGPRTGYDRNLFPQWIDADHDGCDTRHEVLITESVVPAHEGANCALTGQWYSAYDGVTTTDASTFDIDHVVPLAEAWDSGASAWDAARRQAYANDLDHPETLRAVSASANRSKGDDDPTAWKPRLRSDWCGYATDWISIKVTWNLTADPAEVDALRSMLDTCTGAGAPATPVAQPTATSTSTTTSTTTAPPGTGVPAAGVTVSHLDCGGEAVTVGDGGSVPADLTGWTIHDQGTNFTYHFPTGYTLAPSASATVRSGGPPGPGELAWTTRSVWNNDGDTAYLVDAGGTVVSTRSC